VWRRGAQAPRDRTCRVGGRHPGYLEGGALRGASSEGRPRSVRRPSWASPHVGRRADDSGCPKDAEEGNVVAHAPPSVCTGSRYIIVPPVRQTRPSLGPSTRARRSSLCTARAPRGVRSVVGRSFSVSRLGKPTRVGGTSTGVGRTGAARLAACHRIRKGEGVARQKRKEVEASVPARIAEPRLVIRTSCFRCCRSRQATSDLE